MSLIITRHAAQRMVERYVEELDVMRTIAFPDEVEQREDGVVISRKRLGTKLVAVVWHQDSRGNYVVRTII